MQAQLPSRTTRLRSAAMAFALFIPVSAAAAAAEVGNLYAAQTIVTGTEEPERSRGFHAGLIDVIVKLTGDARLAESERLVPLLADSLQTYIEEFEYEDRMKGIPVHDEQGTRERPHFLRMRFKTAEIDKALADLGLSKWPADRPLVAVWLAIETANGRYVLSQSGPEGYGQRAVLTETAERRGIPIVLPDGKGPRRSITFESVAEANLTALRAASPGADVLLAGLLSLGDHGYWNVRWRLNWQDQRRNWAITGVTFDTALKEGLQRTALVLSGNDWVNGKGETPPK